MLYRPAEPLAVTGVMGRRTERCWRAAVVVCERLRSRPPAGTFHSVAVRMLRVHVHRLPGCGRTKDFNIHDTEDNVSMLMDWVKDTRKARSGQAGEDIEMEVPALFHMSVHVAH